MAIIASHWQSILLAMILIAAANIVGYALTSYMPTYLTATKGYDELHGTLLTIPILVAMAAAIPLTGRLSDRIGRRPVLWIGSLGTVVLAVPAFLLIGVGEIWSTLLGLALVAFPLTFYVANLASALPALFPTTSRYGAMGIAYSFAVAIFSGTAPFVIASLIASTGNDMMPAYYLMATSAIGAVAVYFIRETAGRPLLGSMPSVDSVDEAHELVAGQYGNENLDLNEMPFDQTYLPAEMPEPAEPQYAAADRKDRPANGTRGNGFEPNCHMQVPRLDARGSPSRGILVVSHRRPWGTR